MYPFSDLFQFLIAKTVGLGAENQEPRLFPVNLGIAVCSRNIGSGRRQIPFLSPIQDLVKIRVFPNRETETRSHCRAKSLWRIYVRRVFRNNNSANTGSLGGAHYCSQI